MIIEVTAVQRDEKEILRNLMEKYDYELSQYGGDDVNKLGLYGFDYLDNYWQEGAKRWAYFIKVDGKLAGFALILSDYFYLDDRESDYVMSDFFVMYKYRKAGVGKFVANKLFDNTFSAKTVTYPPTKIVQICRIVAWRICHCFTGKSINTKEYGNLI